MHGFWWPVCSFCFVFLFVWIQFDSCFLFVYFHCSSPLSFTVFPSASPSVNRSHLFPIVISLSCLYLQSLLLFYSWFAPSHHSVILFVSLPVSSESLVSSAGCVFAFSLFLLLPRQPFVLFIWLFLFIELSSGSASLNPSLQQNFIFIALHEKPKSFIESSQVICLFWQSALVSVHIYTLRIAPLSVQKPLFK